MAKDMDEAAMPPICRNVLNAVRRVFQFLHRAIVVAAEHHILESSYCGTSTGQLFAVHRNGPVWPAAKLFPVSRLPGEDLLELRAGEVADGVIPVDENAQYIVTNHFAAADLGLFISSEFASDATKRGAPLRRCLETRISTSAPYVAEDHAGVSRK